MNFLKKLFGFFLVPKEKKGSIGEIKKILRKSKAKSRDGKGRFLPDDSAIEKGEVLRPKKAKK
jgi:hypothetical protein